MAQVNVGHYEQALVHLREAENLALQVRAVDQQVNAIGLQSQCFFRLDRWDELLQAEERWRELERRYPRSRVGETCYFVALSATVLNLRGESERAQAYMKESYDYMVAYSGEPDVWQRNQFY
jgi:hypothetical protein